MPAADHHLPSAGTRRTAAWLAALIGLAALVWLALPRLAGAGLHYLAQNAGLQEPRFAVTRLGWRQAEVEQAHFVLRADGGTLAADVAQARLDYTLGWQRPVLHTVAIGQVRLVWQTSPATGSPGARGTPASVRVVPPFERLDIERLELDAATGLGRSLFTGVAAIAVAADGGVEARFRDSAQTFRLNVTPSGEQAGLVAELATGVPIFHAQARRQRNGTLRTTLDADAKTLVEWLAASELLPDKLRTRVAGLAALRDGLGRLGPQLALTLDADPGAGGSRLNGRLLHEGRAIATLRAHKEADGVMQADLRLSAPLSALSSLAAPLLPPPERPRGGRKPARRTGEHNCNKAAIRGRERLTWKRTAWV